MLCPSCRRQAAKGSAWCPSCGQPLTTTEDDPFELILGDGTRLPVVAEVTIGRAADNSVTLEDPTVSRRHARIITGAGGLRIEDTGSSSGTWVDDQKLNGTLRLRDGAKIRLGDSTLRVERRRDDAEAGRTVMVGPGMGALVVGPSKDQVAQATQHGMRPQLRPGWQLKRLDASEGHKRWVFRDLESGKFLRLDDTDAKLLELLNGSNSLADLITLAEQRAGAGAAGRLAKLLADLGERGLLEGVDGARAADQHKNLFQKIIGPRYVEFGRMGPWLDRLYSRGLWALFTRPAKIAYATVGVLGFLAFLYLIIGRYGTPFVVGNRIGLGALVFLLGRFAIVFLHECAHALAMSSFNRKVTRAGMKFMGPIPFGFVDTSEAWFEPRDRRLAISAAGPVVDFSLAGTFALICATLQGGTVRDIFFQLAFAGYIGALFNLHPYMDRDGYHMMADTLREPGLKKRSKAWLEARIAGRPSPEPDASAAFRRYSYGSIAAAPLITVMAVTMSLVFYDRFTAIVPPIVVNVVMVTVWIVTLLPLFLIVGKPLLERFRPGKPDGPEVSGATA